MKHFFVTLVFSVLLCTTTYSQQYVPFPCPCVIDSGNTSIPIIGLTTPFLHSSRAYSGSNINSYPLNIALWYSALNWGMRNMNYGQVDTVLSNMSSMNDTLRYFGKAWYELMDYNPILLNTSSKTNTGWRGIGTLNVYNAVDKYCQYSDSPSLDRLLLSSSYVCLITVDDTLRLKSLTTALAKTSITVTATINDMIKGQVVPSCLNLIPPSSSQRNNVSITSIPATPSFQTNPSCIQFDYRLEMPLWDGGGMVSYNGYNAVDSLGQPWIKKGKQYLVFLHTSSLCIDSLSLHMYITPLIYGKKQSYLMPVVDGMIYDIPNEFRLGVSNTVEQFITKLRQRIATIKMN